MKLALAPAVPAAQPRRKSFSGMRRPLAMARPPVSPRVSNSPSANANHSKLTVSTSKTMTGTLVSPVAMPARADTPGIGRGVSTVRVAPKTFVEPGSPEDEEVYQLPGLDLRPLSALLAPRRPKSRKQTVIIPPPRASFGEVWVSPAVLSTELRGERPPPLSARKASMAVPPRRTLNASGVLSGTLRSTGSTRWNNTLTSITTVSTVSPPRVGRSLSPAIPPPVAPGDLEAFVLHDPDEGGPRRVLSPEAKAFRKRQALQAVTITALEAVMDKTPSL